MSDEIAPSAAPVVSARRRLGRAWLLTTATNGTLGLVVFIVSPWAANILSPEGRGRLTSIQLLPQMLADLSSIGLAWSIVHFGAAKRDSLGTLVRWSTKPAMLGTLVMFLVGQALVLPIVGSDTGDATPMRIYLLICPVTAVMVVNSEALRAIGDFGRWNAFTLARGLAWPMALVVGVAGTPSVSRIAFTHLALLTIITAVLVVVVRERTRNAASEPVTTPDGYVRYGLLSAVSTVPRTANAKLDQVVMAFRVSKDDLGLYTAAAGWSAITIPVMRGFTGIGMPHVSEASAEQVPTRVRHMVTTAFAAVLALTLLGGLMTVLLWRLRYDDEYNSAYAAALILVPAGLLLEYNGILGNVLRSLHRPGVVAVLEVAVLVISTGALFVVLEYDTVTGPALVSLAAYFASSLLYLVVIAGTLRVSVGSLFDPGLITRGVARLTHRRETRTGPRPHR
jgi:O-antigen/teichoic acid export membrane protein